MRLWNLQKQMNLSTMAPWGQEKVAIVERWPLPSREVGTRVNVWTVRKLSRCGASAVSEGSTVFMSQERVLFPAADRHNCCHSETGSFSNDDGDGNQDVKKVIGLLRKTITLHVHHAFLYISLPSLHHYDVKMPKFQVLWRT